MRFFLKYLSTSFCLSFCFLFVACGSDNSDEVKLTNTPIGVLEDSDSTVNQISDTVLSNNVTVGLTAFAADPDDQVKYQLLDSAEDRFKIDELTGVVYVSDYLMLNANLYPLHSINIKATSEDGSSTSQIFDIEVITENEPIGEMNDINLLPNEVLEGIKSEEEIGITVNAKDPNEVDSVSYKLLEDGEALFRVNGTTGVITVTDGSVISTLHDLHHEIKVEALSTDGSSKSKSFNIDVIHNYENDIAIVSQYNTLLNWNEGSQQQLEGWTWYEDIAYGNPGWLLNEDGPIGGGEKYKWGWGVRSFNKGDYGKQNSAIIDTSDRSPSTNSGGSFKVFETEDSTDHRSTWWLWYDGKPLSERNITNATTDRMSFYLKAEGMNPLNDDGGKESIGTNFHIGTYLCWDSEAPSYGTGDGCPYEGPGNQHYYHYLGVSPGAWIHVLLDQYPQHIRGRTRALSNNPTKDKYNKNYFEQLSRFYFEIRNQNSQKTSFRVDELKFFSTTDMIEPTQNEESISSLWVGYWPDKKVWEIGFHDQSHQAYNNDNNSTFEIRWSTLPITNENFSLANKIEPLFYSGPEFVGENNEHLIRRPNGWQSNVWTRFLLPEEISTNYLKVFFAVKDVSVKGKHSGTKWPYNKGDGHDAPSDKIKIIDYYLQ